MSCRNSIPECVTPQAIDECFETPENFLDGRNSGQNCDFFAVSRALSYTELTTTQSVAVKDSADAYDLKHDSQDDKP